MSMSLLPQWLRIAWAVALAGVALLHAWHAWSIPGQPRWWHGGHIIMTLGMMGMYVLGKPHPSLYWVGVVLFAVLTVALGTTAVVFRRREGVLNPLWVASGVDMLAMTYMLLPPAAQPVGVSWVFVSYLACQMLAWTLGLWDRAPMLQPAAAASAPVTTPTSGVGQALGLTAHCTPAIRVSLAVMAASMAYMLAIM